MNCLYCAKPIDSLNQKVSNGWHQRCAMAFFGATIVPEIDWNRQMMDKLADEAIHRGDTVTGVQKKISLDLTWKETTPKFTVVDSIAGYILKPQSEVYPQLPEAEDLAMRLAKLCQINTVPFGMIELGDAKERAYITKRIDRMLRPEGLAKLAMEDFAQLAERMTEDKYKSSYEQCGKLINKYSVTPGLDLSEFMLKVVFCFVIGNSDMHLKNFSLIEDAPGSRRFRLSPAYDLLPVQLVHPADDEDTALTVNGKKKNLRTKDFFALGKTIGLNDKVTENMIKKVVRTKQAMEDMIQQSYIKPDFKKAFIDLINHQVRRLTE